MKKPIRQITKIKIGFLIFGLALIAALIAAVIVSGNIFLAANKDAINKKANEYFTHDISIGRIIYAFPDRAILSDIVIKKPAPSSKSSSFVLPKIAVRFSLLDILFKRSLNISQVTLDSSEVSYYSVSLFLEDNSQEILEMIKNSPSNDVKIRIKESLLDFDRKGQPDYIVIDLLLTIREDFMTGVGFFRADQYRFPTQEGEKVRRVAKGWPLWYHMEGWLKEDGFMIDQLIFKSGKLYSKLQGSMRSGLLKINGFAFMNTTKQDPGEEEYLSSRYFKNFPKDEELAHVDTYILDIDGRANLAFPDIEVEKLNFTLNNMPMSLTGSVSLLDPLTLEANLSLRHAQSIGAKDAFFEKADVTLSGTWKDGVLNTHGQAYIDFIKSADLSFSPETARAAFKGLSFSFDERRRSHINLANGDITYWTNNNEHKVSVQDFKAVTDIKKEGLKSVEIHASFYDGSLNGRILVDSTQFPSKITSEITLLDVDTHALEELLVHFAKFNGRMSSKMNFTNTPQMDLSGKINIYDGRLTDFSFFNWLGDSFRLPALKSIDFGTATAQFSINQESIQLRDIELETSDVRVGGYFDVNSQNLVSSQITLDLSQGLLRTSSKFRPILKIFEEDVTYLNFDFRLSGNLDAMNFQWMPSEIKSKMQLRIPDFIERKIERSIDKIMDAGPESPKKND